MAANLPQFCDTGGDGEMEPDTNPDQVDRQIYRLYCKDSEPISISITAENLILGKEILYQRIKGYKNLNSSPIYDWLRSLT